MADKGNAPAAAAAKGDDDGGQAADRDRVVMASRAPDGTPVQHNPELIGPRDDAEEGARRQLAEQAVSITDQRQVEADRRAAAGDDQQDPGIDERRKAHDEAAKAAEGKASAEVRRLHSEGGK